jgi:general secretion pathway protein A
MYNEYFGFKESPFSIAPDPRYLYMTAQHREALAHLVYGLNSEGGCILLTGEVGTGKTTICRCLLEQIPEQSNVALVLNPKVSEIELLETICDELKIAYPASDNSVKTYTDRIYEFLIESNRKNEKTVLIIDEAQNLDSKVLEQLRLLTNLETHERKLLQIIILGQPELLDILARSEMRQLAQRITARFHLRPLTKSEIKAYVSHRLAIAGQNIQLFPENSIKLLYRLSNGIPRLINIICDRALLGAYVENQYVVNPQIVKKAAKEVFGELKNVEKSQKNRRWLYPAAAFTALALFAMTLLTFLLLQQENITGIDVTETAYKTNTQSQLLPDNTESSAAGLTTEETSTEPSAAINRMTAMTESPTISAAENASMADKADAIERTAAASSTLAGYDSIDRVLKDSANNQAAAFQQLFTIWGKHYDAQTATTACKQAERFSLSCLYKNGNLNTLKIHNRPAVLTLINSQGEPRYVVIASIEDESATIYSNGTAVTVSLRDLDRYWYGQFTLLWQKPEHYTSPVTPGDSSNIVNWLYTQLAKIDHEQTVNRIYGKYDNYLVDKVKALQLRQGLEADGIVGPITIIHINTLSGMDVPSLSARPGSTTVPSTATSSFPQG